jgi:serine/threonine-protein kinase RIO1
MVPQAMFSGSSQDEQRAALNWAECMRQHGINMPDPQVTAEGVLLDEQLPTGMRKDDPRLRAAEQTCRQRGGGGK